MQGGGMPSVEPVGHTEQGGGNPSGWGGAMAAGQEPDVAASAGARGGDEAGPCLHIRDHPQPCSICSAAPVRT